MISISENIQTIITEETILIYLIQQGTLWYVYSYDLDVRNVY